MFSRVANKKKNDAGKIVLAVAQTVNDASEPRVAGAVSRVAAGGVGSKVTSGVLSSCRERRCSQDCACSRAIGKWRIRTQSGGCRQPSGRRIPRQRSTVAIAQTVTGVPEPRRAGAGLGIGSKEARQPRVQGSAAAVISPWSESLRARCILSKRTSQSFLALFF